VGSPSTRIVELLVRHEGTIDLWLNGERLVDKKYGGWEDEPRRVRAAVLCERLDVRIGLEALELPIRDVVDASDTVPARDCGGIVGERPEHQPA